MTPTEDHILGCMLTEEPELRGLSEGESLQHAKLQKVMEDCIEAK